MGVWEGETGGVEEMRGEERGGVPMFTPDVGNPEKYPDCRTDLIGGAATQMFAPGGKHPPAATVPAATANMLNKS